MTLTTRDGTDALAERLFGATLGRAQALLHLPRHRARPLPRPHPERAADLLRARRPRRDRAPLRTRVARAAGLAGLLDVEHPGATADARRYALAPDHDRVLVDADDPAHVAP